MRARAFALGGALTEPCEGRACVWQKSGGTSSHEHCLLNVTPDPA